MNTIIDLNNLANVNFNNESNYAISFGTNAGNTTATIDSFFGANITKQTPLNSITDAVRDLLIDVQFSNVGAVSMAYAGPYSNIGVLQIAPAAWRVSGIRSVDQYDEAFANVRYTDLLGSGNTSPEYSYTTTVNDQSGNTRTWTTTVDVLQQPAFTISGPLVYDEDTLTPMTQVSVAVDPTSTNVFRFYANTVPTYGSMTDGVVTGNSVSIDGNVTTLNATLAAGQIKFLPASDYVANTANAINIALQKTGTTLRTGNVDIEIGNTHGEFNFPTSASYTEDTRYSFGNIITDQDTRATSFSISLQQTAGNIGQWYRNSSLVGNANVALEITGSKNSINNSIQWMPPINYTGNVDIVYDQIKTLPTGNVTQASNVVATFDAITNPDIANMIDRAYTSNVVNSIFANSTPVLDDGPDYGQTYTITLSSTLGKFGNSAANAVATSSYSFTGNTTQVNGQFALMKFVPTANVPASTGTFVYTQSRNGVPQVNQTLNLTGTTQAFLSTREFLSTPSELPRLSFEEQYFGTNMRVVAVGGGGGGAARGSAPFGGPGGGGGNVVVQDWGKFTNSFYSVLIGSGGSASSPGTNTTVGLGTGSLYNVVATGGRPGAVAGGNSTITINGVATTYTGGGNASDGTVYYGGGGAGAGGNGNGGGGGVPLGPSGNGGTGYTVPTISTLVSVGGGGAGTDRAAGPRSTAPGSGGGGGRLPTVATAGRNGAAYIIWT